MNTIKYLVYSGEGSDNLLAWFDEEVEAIAFAKENVGEQTRVEKAECDLAEDGFLNEIINSKTIWSYLDNNVNEFDQEFPEEEPDEFDTDFPESDINDFNGSDDEDFGGYAWEDDNKLMQGFSMREAVDALEENESEVECKCCFELFPKEDCIKTEKGYLCKKCNQELHSHQGTNLDLIDKDPFSLNYEDPRDPEEVKELEIKEEPVDANEIRKHEAGIDEQLEKEIKTEWDVFNHYINKWLDCDADNDMLEIAFERGLKGKDLPSKWYDAAWIQWDDFDYLESINGVGKDIKSKGLQAVIQDIAEAESETGDPQDIQDLKEHVNDRPADIESDQVLQGVDNAVVDCKKYTVVAHSEDEKPVDCKLEKPALEEPLAGEKVDGKFYEELSDEEKKALDEEIENLDLEEAKKDDELPVDPEAAKLEVHTMLNDLVADEIEAINGYEEAKKEILDTPIAHKDNILDTIDHVEDEEKEHVDELISATTEIPFDKESDEVKLEQEERLADEANKEIRAKIENGEVEEEPLDQDFPEVEENLEERVDLPAFDSDVKEGDSILIVNMEGEPDYCGRKGKVEHIDSLGQLHGTWGGLAVIPGVDKFDIITDECLKEDAKAPKYKAVVSWEGTFCGDKRVYKNDRFHTYEFDHEPTKQEVEDRFYNDPNIVRLKNWKVTNVRKEVKDFMDGAYDNDAGWKDIKLTGYKLIIKESLDENWIIQPEIGEKLRIASDQAALNDFKRWANSQQAVDKFEKYLGKVGTVTYVDGNIVNLKFDDMNENERLTLPRWFLHQFVSSVDGWAIVHENLNEEKEAGDKVKSYNDGLKLAKVYNKPVIYGYENKSYGGKFFALDDPIVCTSVVDETKKFKQQYKSCGVVYVAYPDKDFAESLKESMKLSEYWWEDNDPMNQVDQEEDNVECGWCGESYPKSECRHEQDFGYLCPQCEAELKSRGEELVFIENEDLEQKHEDDKWAITIDGEQKFIGTESEMKDKMAELEKTDAVVAHKVELVKGADVLVKEE